MLSMVIIGQCPSVRRPAGAAPCTVGLLIGGAIALLGTTSRASAEPEQQFGRAVISGKARFLQAYLLPPMHGAALAVAARGEPTRPPARS